MTGKQASGLPGLPSNLPLTLFKMPSNDGIGFRCGSNALVTDPQSSTPVILVMLPSHDAPYTNLTCCPVTHLAVL